jgi:hypothetical protein
MLLAIMNSVKVILRLIGDLLAFLWLVMQRRNALAAENLFLRKQLVIYQERKLVMSFLGSEAK